MTKRAGALRPTGAVLIATWLAAAVPTPSQTTTGANAPTVRSAPGRVDTLRSIGGLDPDVAGLFREALDFQQTAAGQYLVFDHRGHTVYSINADGRTWRKMVEIGGEAGRIIAPSAFAAAPDGTFVVADAPNGSVPLVVPTVRTAAVDLDGRLWVSFTIPFTYVFDEEGDKIRTVRFHAAGVVSPTSLFFAAKGRLLVTPGCYEFSSVD